MHVLPGDVSSPLTVPPSAWHITPSISSGFTAFLIAFLTYVSSQSFLCLRDKLVHKTACFISSNTVFDLSYIFTCEGHITHRQCTVITAKFIKNTTVCLRKINISVHACAYSLMAYCLVNEHYQNGFYFSNNIYNNLILCSRNTNSW